MASIDQLLETLANPEGRFKTLEGIHLESENGEPHYSLHCGGAVAVFRHRAPVLFCPCVVEQPPV